MKNTVLYICIVATAMASAIARAADDVNSYELVCEWIEPKNKSDGGFRIDNPGKKLSPIIRSWIKKGWKPIGGVNITALPGKYSADLLACQALVY